MARVARLGIVVDASGARRGADEANSALKTVDQTAQRTVRTMQAAAAALGVAFGVRALQQSIDEYTLLDARLRQVAGSSAAFARVQQDLFAIAQNTRQSYAATVDLYTRLARSIDQLGISQTQLVSVTEAVSNAVRLSNASTGAAEAGLVQLGQAFASGTLRGDELRSIMEQLPAVAKAIADGLGVPIGKLREMGEAGELSGRKVALALDSQREKLALLAGEIPTTVGQAIQQLNNAFGMVVAGSNEAKSATQGVAGAIGAAARWMVEYQDAVVAVTVALGAAGLTGVAVKAGAALLAASSGGAVAGLLALVPAITSASAAFAFLQLAAAAAWTAITGPVGLAVAAVTAVAGAVYLWRKRQDEATEAVKATVKSAAELYDAAKRVASVTWVPTETLTQIQNLGGELRAAQSGGKQAVDAFREAAKQWKDTGDSTRTFAQALADGDQKARTLYDTIRAQVALSSQVESTLERQTKAQRDAAKAAEDRATIERDYQAQVVLLGIELANRAMAAQEAHNEAVRDGVRAYTTLLTIRRTENAQLREQVAALSQGALAYTQVTQAQQTQAAFTAALNDAKARGLALSPQQLVFLLAEIKETERLTRVKQALLALNGENPFTLPVEETRQWADTLTEVASTAQQIGQIFGQVGSTIAKMAQLAGQVGTSLINASRAASALEKARGTPKEGAAQAASTAATVTSVLSVAAAVTTGISAWVNGARQSAEEARQLAIALREARAAAKASAEQFIAQGGLPLEREKAAITSGFEDVIKALLAAGAPRVDRLGPRTAQSVIPTADLVNQVIDRYEELIRKAEEAAAFALEQATADLDVRRLVAAGREDEAELLRLQRRQIKERRDAEEEYGKNSPYLQHLAEVQAAEMAAAEAAQARKQLEIARRREDVGFDITARRQTLDGDARGAFVTRQGAGAMAALREAEDLYKAGTISAEMFAELSRIIGDELTQAIQDFDQAAAEAAEQTRLAAEAAERERIAAIQEKQTAIIREMIDAYKVLDPQMAASLEQQQQTIDRNARLADTTDEVTRAQLQHLFALQDEAAAQVAAAQAAEAAARAIERQTQAAERFAQVGADAEERYLRATGQTFEADRKRRTRERDEQLRDAAEAFGGLGLSLNPNSPNFLQQVQQFAAQQAEFQKIVDFINGAYEADVAALIASTINNAAPGSGGASTAGGAGAGFGAAGRDASLPILGGDSVTYRSAASMTETSATRLIDFASAQLSVQRRILQVLEEKTGAGPSDLLAPAVLDRLDTAFGTRQTDSALLIGGRVL